MKTSVLDLDLFCAHACGEYVSILLTVDPYLMQYDKCVLWVCKCASLLKCSLLCLHELVRSYIWSTSQVVLLKVNFSIFSDLS